jgi:hypothetical protein
VKPWTLGEIARALNQHDGTNLTTRNVSRHFETRVPRESTVRAYQGLLSFHERHIRAVLDQLTDADLRWAFRSIQRDFAEVQLLDARIALRDIDAAVSDLADSGLGSISEPLRRYVLSRERHQRGIPTALSLAPEIVPRSQHAWWSTHAALFEFVDALRERGVNLFSRFSRRVQSVHVLAPRQVAGWVEQTWDMLRDEDLVKLHLRKLFRTLRHNQPAFLFDVIEYLDARGDRDSFVNLEHEKIRRLYGGVSAASILRELDSENEAGAYCETLVTGAKS